MARVYLSLGSNLGDREATLQAAVAALGAVGSVAACSHVYETAPWGDSDQPHFLNLCCALDTTLPARDLLGHTQAIERDLGRVPTRRWGPRALDVDLLVYGDLRLATPDLTLPHPRIAERAFVLAPLAEIARHLRIGGDTPESSRSVADLLAALGDVSGDVRAVGPPPAVRSSR